MIGAMRAEIALFGKFPKRRPHPSSATQSARLLAVFIVDTRDTILTIPYHE
jgi:hypothetical protein